MVTRVVVSMVPWDQARVRNVLRMRAAIPGLEVVHDRCHNAWDTWIRVLALVGSDQAILMEDDVELAENWRERVEEIISEYRDDVIQFFSLAKTVGPDGIERRPPSSFSSNLCYYLPEDAAASLLRFAPGWAKRHPEHPTGYDLAMRDWLKSVGRQYLLVTPSLVQHRRMRSVIDPSRSSRRQSVSFRG